MTTTTNILIAAVGGQGALLAARILGNFAAAQGLDVKISEIHGMAQRGGSVVTHVRFGAQVHSPVIESGTADALLAFELLESARYVPMLKPGASLIVGTQKIPPLPVLTGSQSYPEDLLQRFGKLPVTTIAVNALAEAEAVGNVKAVNSVLLGAYAGHVAAERAAFHAAIASSVRPAHLAVNILAFDRGYAVASRREESKS